jgi:hypothetical protein
LTARNTCSAQAKSWIANQGKHNGKCIESGYVDLRVNRIDGVWNPGGIWNTARGIRIDAPRDANEPREGAG